MAPRARGAQPAGPASKQPQKKSKLELAACYVGIPVALVAFILGVGGVAVLMDEPDRTHWYSHTKFADIWRMLVQKNPFIATICVNGGAVMMIILGSMLHEHRRALAAERERQKKVKVRKAE